MGGTGSKFDPRRLSQDDRNKLEDGKPITPIPGVKITKDPKTGKLIGVPQEWARNYELPIPVDMERTVKTKHFAE